MSQPSYQNLDVINRLVSNFREDKPLLTGVVLFRGSRFGDSETHRDSPEMLHAHLLPQVAASYTHNWKKGEAFIDTYPIDREQTKFYANLNLDEHLKGNRATAYSVAEVERAIKPLVENLAFHPASSKAWARQVEDLERYIKASFYEAGVPARTPDGSQTKPHEKFFYSGGPKVASSKEVFDSLERVAPHNEARAKAVFAAQRPTETTAAIEKLEQLHPASARAFQVLRSAVQRDQATVVLTKHGGKPLMDFITAARAEPSGEAHSRVLRLAHGLANGLQSSDAGIRARAHTVTKQIAKLDPATASLRDISKQVALLSTATSAQVTSASRTSTGTRDGPPIGVTQPPRASPELRQAMAR